MYIQCTVGSNTYSFKELNVNQYKEILKITYGDAPSIPLFITNLCKILENIFEKPYEYFYSDVSIFEVFLLLLQLRINSLGTKTSISILNKENKKHVIDLNLNSIFEDLNNLLLVYSQQHYTINDKIDLEISFPSIEKLQSQNLDPYYLFIKRLFVKQSYVLKDWYQIQLILNNVSAKHTSQLNGILEATTTEINNLNLLEPYSVDSKVNMVFSCSLESLLWFSKLIFNEDLDIFYSNLFYLSYTGHLNSTFIENCTPGEYLYFVRKLQETIAKQNQSNKEQPFQAPNSGEALTDPNQFFNDPL